MRRTIFLILFALGLIAILLFIFNPDLLEKIWLWVIGLIGIIISTIKNLINSLVDFFRKDKEEEKVKSVPEGKPQPTVETDSQAKPVEKVIQYNTALEQKVSDYQVRIGQLESEVKTLEDRLKTAQIVDDFKGCTLDVIRYVHDKETTLGLLFLNKEFFSYTLEDTYREVKVMGKTRIPAGTYDVDYNRYLTELTKKYRESRPWFTYHLHVKNVPGFEGIYIHSGSTHEDTAGCLLVASNIYVEDAKKSIFNSRKTFEILYKDLSKRLDAGERVRINYYDEEFMKYSILKNKAS